MLSGRGSEAVALRALLFVNLNKLGRSGTDHMCRFGVVVLYPKWHFIISLIPFALYRRDLDSGMECQAITVQAKEHVHGQTF